MDIVLNIIHDDRVFNRLPPLLEQCEKYGIKYKVWDACLDKKTVLECITESFRRIIQEVKDNGLREVFIAEDDLMFPSDGSWDYFLKNKPDVYDVYIGGSYLIDNRWKYEPPIVKVNSWVGNHLIVVNKSYYDRWLSSKPDGHIDTEQEGKGDFYVCFPYAALQRPSMSANNRTFVNYNAMLETIPEYIYKG